jgi:ribosome maturation factor RimP
MYHDISPELLAVIEPVARGHGLEIVDAFVKRGQGRGQVRVIVDTPEGDGRVNVDACAAVSREIGHGLDAVDAVPGAYMLEVSSPGIDRVLGRPVDFERCVGRQVSLETRTPLDGRRRFRGELVAFARDEVTVRQDERQIAIPFEQIARAKALFPADAPGARR